MSLVFLFKTLISLSATTQVVIAIKVETSPYVKLAREGGLSQFGGAPLGLMASGSFDRSDDMFK
jgi:hypothetical protein